MHFQGHKIDVGTKIADLGIGYGDTIEVVQPVSIDLESQVQEYKSQVEKLQTELTEVKQERDQLKEEVTELKKRVKQLEEMKPKASVHKNPFERSPLKSNPFSMDENDELYTNGEYTLNGEEMPGNEEIPGTEAVDAEASIPQTATENGETTEEVKQEELTPEETAEEVARRKKGEATRRARREARQAAHRAAKAQPAQRGIWEPTEEDKETARSVFMVLTHQDEDSVSDAVTGWCWDQGLDDASILEM